MSPLSSGRRVVVGWGKESSRGVGVAPDYCIETTEHNMNPGIEHIRSEGARGRIEGVSGADVARKFAEPAFGGSVFDKSFPSLMLVAFGAVNTTADSPEDDVNTHIFSVAQNNEHPSLTITMFEPSGAQRAPLAMLRSLDIDITTDNYVGFAAEFDSRSPVDTTGTPSIVEESRFTPKKATVKLATTAAGLDAASAVKIQSGSVTITKNTTRHHSVGEVEPDAITNGTFAVTGELELRYESSAYRDMLLNGTKRAIRITLEDTDTTIGEESHPLIEFEMPVVSLETYERSEGNDDIMMQKIGFIAEYSIADGKMISAKVINDVASY